MLDPAGAGNLILGLRRCFADHKLPSGPESGALKVPLLKEPTSKCGKKKASKSRRSPGLPAGR
jgi:hypothetical protein